MNENSNNNNASKASKIRLGTPKQLLMVCGIVLIVMLTTYGMLWCVTFAHTVQSEKNVCGSIISSLAKAIIVYVNDDTLGRYPDPNKWCDLLLSANFTGEKVFICPYSKTKRGQSNYAMNKNLIEMKPSHISADIVLLFEAKPGWNQFGGPELLTFENQRL